MVYNTHLCTRYKGTQRYNVHVSICNVHCHCEPVEHQVLSRHLCVFLKGVFCIQLNFNLETSFTLVAQQVLQLCVFLKGGEKAVSDTKCHIGRDINCRSDELGLEQPGFVL